MNCVENHQRFFGCFFFKAVLMADTEKCKYEFTGFCSGVSVSY